MNSELFEVTAKALVVKKARELIGIELEESDLHIVFFTYILGNIKATIFGQKLLGYYAEVTFDRAQDQVYVDLYQKISSSVHASDEITHM